MCPRSQSSVANGTPSSLMMLSLPEGDAFTKLMNCHALACADELRGSHTPKGTKRSLIASEQSRLNRYPPQP